MKKLYKIFYSTIVILLVFTNNSCKKDKGAEPSVVPATVTLGVADVNVKGYQVMTVSIANLTLDKPEYELEIGSKKVKGLKNPDNSISFMVPADLPSGKHILKSAFASNQLELTVTAPTIIADPAKTFTDIVGNTTTEVSTITAMLGESTPPAYLIAAKQKIDAGMAKFNQLSAADKQIAAQILEANSKILLDAENVLKDYSLSLASRTLTVDGTTPRTLATCDFECYGTQFVKLLLGAALVVEAGVLTPAIGAVIAVVVVDVFASIITGERSFLVAKLKAAIATGFEFAYFPQIKFLEFTIDNAQKEINSGITTKAITGAKILRSEPFNFQLSPVYRTLRKTDGQNKNLPFLAPLIGAYDKAKAAYDMYFASEMGPFPGFSSKEEKLPAKLLSDWEIKITSGNGITVTNPVGTAENFNVTFNSTSAVEQNFEFDINYKWKYETITEHVTATLFPGREPAKVEMLSGNNQTGEATKKLTEPLQVTVKDINGKVLENVKVQWSIKSGGGTLSAVESATDSKGIAKIEWTMGTANPQEVEAVVKNKDGSSVSGSPLTFKALLPVNIVYKWTLVKEVSKAYSKENVLTYSSVHTGADINLATIEFTADKKAIFTYKKGYVEMAKYTRSQDMNVIAIESVIPGELEDNYEATYEIVSATENTLVLQSRLIIFSRENGTVELTLTR